MSKILTFIAAFISATVWHSFAKEADDPTSSELPNGDLLVTDFEQRDLGRMRAWGWNFQGDAFQQEFHHGTRKLRARVGRYTGKWFLTSVTENPKARGTLTSPPFSIQRPFVAFLLSGGSSPIFLQANLIIEGKVVRNVTGSDSDLFEPVVFNVKEFNGKEARFQIVDNATKMWGHINVDHIVQTANPNSQRVISSPPKLPVPEAGFAHLMDTGNRIRGPFSVQEGKLVDPEGQSTALENTLTVSTNNSLILNGKPDSVVLRNGEIWFGKIAGIENQTITLQSPALQNQSIPIHSIARLEFNKTAQQTKEGTEPNTLYRQAGEPIPGKLIWIRDKDIAIDCTFGVIPIPRAGVRRFVVSAEKSEGVEKQDELVMTDGTIIRGKLTLDGNQVSLEHSSLGQLKFPLSSIHSFKRRPPNVVWLSDLNAKSVEASGPLLAPPTPKMVDAGKNSLNSVRINAHSKLTYSTPKLSPGTVTFRATILPGLGNRGSANASLSSLDKNFFAEIDPGTKERTVSFPLRPGTDLELEVSFRGRLVFPCAIDWRDAHFVSIPDNGVKTETKTEGA